MPAAFRARRPAPLSAATWRKIARITPAVVSDILHAQGLHDRVMQFEIQPLDPATHLAGLVRTMSSRPLVGEPKPGREYELLFEAIDGLGAGEVLVTDRMDCCAWGELCAEAAMRRGGNGAVIDGFTRDSAELRRLGFPLWCRGRHMSDMLYHRVITGINEPVLSGGVAVHPGDLLLGSEDGVVVVPARRIEAVVDAAYAKSTAESKVRTALRRGMSAGAAYKKYGVM